MPSRQFYERQLDAHQRGTPARCDCCGQSFTPSERKVIYEDSYLRIKNDRAKTKYKNKKWFIDLYFNKHGEGNFSNHKEYTFCPALLCKTCKKNILENLYFDARIHLCTYPDDEMKKYQNQSHSGFIRYPNAQHTHSPSCDCCNNGTESSDDFGILTHYNNMEFSLSFSILNKSKAFALLCWVCKINILKSMNMNLKLSTKGFSLIE